MLRDVDYLANTFEGRGKGTKTQSQYKKEWEDLYERFAKRVDSDTSLGNTLKHILLEYFSVAAVRLPAIFRGGFLPE
jgi:hypothetical protein